MPPRLPPAGGETGEEPVHADRDLNRRDRAQDVAPTHRPVQPRFGFRQLECLGEGPGCDMPEDVEPWLFG